MINFREMRRALQIADWRKSAVWRDGRWSMAVVLKTTEPETVSGFKIPLSPPFPRCARAWRRGTASGAPRRAHARRGGHESLSLRLIDEQVSTPGWPRSRRHLANLTRPELTRALRALSSCYVERRDKLTSGAALEGAGKRAAFALFYGPLHFLTVTAVVRALLANEIPIDTILDLGCGTGVGGAAWAMACATRPAIAGIDRNGWAVQEANWTYKAFGLRGHAKTGDVIRNYPASGPEDGGAARVCRQRASRRHARRAARARLPPRRIPAPHRRTDRARRDELVAGMDRAPRGGRRARRRVALPGEAPAADAPDRERRGPRPRAPLHRRGPSAVTVCRLPFAFACRLPPFAFCLCPSAFGRCRRP